MKIKVINPNTSSQMTDDIRDSAKLGARTGTEIICVNPDKGPETIESWYDEYICQRYLVEVLLKTEKEDPVDAYVVACFADPGVNGLRELTDKPVVGIAEAAIAMSSFLAARFAIVTIMPRIRLMMGEMIRRYGAEHRCVSIRTPDLAVADFMNDMPRCERIMIEEAKDAVKKDYAEAILLGCAGMGPFIKKARQAVPALIIDSVTAGVKMAESLVDLGLKTCKTITYQPPEKKRFIGMDDLYQP